MLSSAATPYGPGGRIVNWVQIPDGTAAVSAEDVYVTKVGHWETEKACTRAGDA